MLITHLNQVFCKEITFSAQIDPNNEIISSQTLMHPYDLPIVETVNQVLMKKCHIFSYHMTTKIDILNFYFYLKSNGQIDQGYNLQYT